MTRELVAVQLQGGLGNQLFQFAAVKGLQSDPLSAAVVDSRSASFWGPQLGRVLLDSAFREVGQLELLALGQLPHLPVKQGTAEALWVRRAPAVLARFAARRRFAEAPALGFDDRVLRTTRPILLSGYFQSERYFAGREAALLASFRPAPTRCQALRAQIDELAAGRVLVGVSLRSGEDYGKLGWVLQAPYYRAAAALLRERLGAVCFVVVGDVAADSRELCALLAEFGPAAPFAGEPAEVQLHLFASLPHVILANSSFAWWGAWLGDQQYAGKDRLVLRPLPWLPAPPGEVCPDRWQPLDAAFATGW